MKYERCYPFVGLYKVTSLFGFRTPPSTSGGKGSRDHKGIDLAPTKLDYLGTAAIACADGVVTKSKFDKTLGNFVWIRTDEGYGVIYQHLASVNVKAGDKVSCRQIIGKVGNTGNSGGVHLHFGVAGNSDMKSYYENDWFNPLFYFGLESSNIKVGSVIRGDNNIDASSTSYTTTSSEFTSLGYLDSLVPSGEFYEVDKLSGVYGDWLYGRRYRVFVELDNGKSLDVSELKCTFEIVKDMTSLEANTSKLSIYNLNPNDENLFIQHGSKIVIEAGYAGSQYGVIFSGNVVQALRSKENGVDYCLTLVSFDADRYVTYGLINISLASKQTMRKARDTLMTKSSYDVGSGFLTDTNISYPRGKVMFGMSKDYLAQISKTTNSTFYIDDGKLNIVSAPDIQKGRILSFGPDSGLINFPEQNELGISCEVLLNPQVKLNSLFHLDNERVKNQEYSLGQAIRQLDTEGIYRVVKLTHVGDTHGKDWYTKIDAISQAGILNSAVPGAALYPW